MQCHHVTVGLGCKYREASDYPYFEECLPVPRGLCRYRVQDAVMGYGHEIRALHWLAPDETMGTSTKVGAGPPNRDSQPAVNRERIRGLLVAA